METNLNYALQITLIGMSLVFGAILLLWIVMGVIVRVTATAESQAEIPETEAVSDEAATLLKRRAAAVAVAIALEQHHQSETQHAFPLPSTALVSAWQAVMRSNQLRQRGPIR